MRTVSSLVVTLVAVAGIIGCQAGVQRTGTPSATTATTVTQDHVGRTVPPAAAPPAGSSSPPTTSGQSSLPTLGTSAPLRGYALDGAGFGQAEPSEIYLGGDSTGRVGRIVWQSWGGPEAKGTGQGWWVGPGQTVAQGSVRPATVVAFNLSHCGGQSAYQTVEWFFPNEGQQFDPGVDSNYCTVDGKRAGVDTDTAELAARCVLGAYLRRDPVRASDCAGSQSTALDLFGQLGGYDRASLAKYAVDFTGCVPAPESQSGSHDQSAGTRVNCRFGNGPNDYPAGVWMVVTAAGPPFHVVAIGPP